jgi:MoxR-like ATPase
VITTIDETQFLPLARALILKKLMTDSNKMDLDVYRQQVILFENAINQIVLGLNHQVRLLTIAVLSRGHVLLEGDVGVGKTTLLRAAARLLGGQYQRIEGAVDLMPSDFLYHAYINQNGQPSVAPGPLLQHGEELAVFFFNEINRARPQAHSMLLRLMAERSAHAFNREYYFPHLTVFADRNRLEREETFELPAAARDRFFMEINISAPDDFELQRALMFDVKFQQVDKMITGLYEGVVPFAAMNTMFEMIQKHVRAEPVFQDYAVHLWRTLKDPVAAGITLDGIDMPRLIAGGASPRGVGMLMTAARTRAWLEQRDYLTPDDIRSVFHAVMMHRIFFTPAYELRRNDIAPKLLDAVLSHVTAP